MNGTQHLEIAALMALAAPSARATGSALVSPWQQSTKASWTNGIMRPTKALILRAWLASARKL